MHFSLVLTKTQQLNDLALPHEHDADILLAKSTLNGST